MKILILSNTSWDIENSFGNSFSNIFEGIDNIEIANIYCRYGKPNNNVVKKYFQMTEKSLLKNLINKDVASGNKVYINNKIDLLKESEQKVFDYSRKTRYQIFFWARDLIWKIGRWKSPELKEFIDEFNPDIIFQPIYYSNYLNDISLFVKEYTEVPMVGYVSDDIYTLKQFNLSPLYWIDRFIKRRKIKKVVDSCEYLYVISDIQKKDYERIFAKNCKILTKGLDFSSKPNIDKKDNDIQKFVYTGNIGSGRWKSLVLIAEALKKINEKEIKAELYIYTATPTSDKIIKQLSIENTSFFMGRVPYAEVNMIQKEASALVHVEPTDLQGELLVRHSFSTKIIDYMHVAKCIFAVGKPQMASIKYLLDNNAAIVATNEEELETKLYEIIDTPEIKRKFIQNAWNLGKSNHQIDLIQKNLFDDLYSLYEKSK